MTPAAVVAALDRHVVGQAAAKRAVAVALRNRLRRQALDAALAEDVTPRNILMIGPTGVGKTEIARRLAKLSNSPFLKIEASKFTEVGYVGRDVESMIRDLTAQAVQLVTEEQQARVAERAAERAHERLLDLLAGDSPPSPTNEGESAARARREALRAPLAAGQLEDRLVDFDVQESVQPPGFALLGAPGMESLDSGLGDMLKGLFPKKTTRRKLSVREARALLVTEAAEALVDQGEVQRIALERVQSSGIIFLDELDKVAGRERGTGPDVSREGVQRDLLPIVEGTTVQTKWGPVRTDHVLFIAAGAFHVAKPSDLIPELQGRFPVRVEMSSLGREELVRILREPESSLTKQCVALLATEGVRLSFTDEAVEALADYAMRVNEATEDIGARRLHAILETVLEDISFRAGDLSGQDVVVDAALVQERLEAVVADKDYSRYVL